ncbi:type II toxin-antitoxin system RelE/ParE family toxin [Labrys sp. KNU-23]|uniref:type II toxin-antitoxin system RelE/ParE family toxin n=1 Tax=Labrys sp. KNU-23 TaxID=2789216 RepID=UPI0011ED3BA7|nr:type II toxin-antitoxin system RelE/ParE family toxin [Labrys sp. KNU-23]QEN89370.1 type II toxin-antitoxin system RelE/ParE family toxin [Labrys sp. KNU-23]
MKLVWLPAARRTRTALIEYIAKDSLAAALDQLSEIQNQVRNLEDHPEMGRVGRVSNTRELVVARTSFLIIYRIRHKARQIEILRVIHGAQRWPPKK